MEILVASDVHLTNYPAFNKDVSNKPQSGSRLELILDALSLFFKEGKSRGINTFVINGDLFDKRQRENPTTFAYIQDQFISSYQNNAPKGSTLYLNVGNHDELTQGVNPNSLTSFELMSTNNHAIRIIGKDSDVEVVKFDDDTQIMFIPYTEYIEEQKELINNTLSEVNIPTTVFAHLGVEGGTQGQWQHRLAGAYSLHDLGWNNTYVNNIILGHYHNRQFIKKDDGKQAWYVGSLMPLSFNDVKKNGEGASRGFDIIDTSKGSGPVDTVMVTDTLNGTFNVITFDNLENNLDLFIEKSKDNYIKIVCSYNQSKELEQDKYKELNLDNIKIELNDIDLDVSDTFDVDVSGSAKDIISNYCDEYYPEFKKDALDYLNKAQEGNV